MESMIRIIKQKVQRVRLRWCIKKCITYGLGGLVIGTVLSTILALSSLMMPVMFLYIKMGVILGSSTIGGMLTSLFCMPSSMETARVIDKQGLQERTMTALEFMGQSNPYGELVIKDACNKLKNIQPKEIMSLKPPKKHLMSALIAIMIFSVVLLIPSPYRDEVHHKEKLHVAKKEEKNKIKKVKKEIEDNKYLTKEDKKDLEKLLTKLNKEIMNARDEKELTKKAEANKELMTFKKNKALEKRFNDITKQLKANDHTKTLGNALAKQDSELAREEIKKLMKEVSQMSKDEYNAMLNNLSNQLANMSQEQLNQTLNQLAEDMSLTNNQLSNSQFASSNSKISDKQSPSSSSGQDPSSGNQGNNANGENSSNGSSNGQGNGGSGQGNESGGQGNGGGSGNASKGGTGKGGSGTGGKGRGFGSANSETDGTGVDGTVTDEQANGQRGNKNSQLQIMREGVSIAGEKVPYDRVIGEYENKAYESMNSSDIPKGMQEVVKEYFSGLN